MHKLPKITIITPSYNQGQYIEQTITSVLDQAYPNLEYIIIDGGSTDQTLDIIKRYERYITYWVSEKDKGQSDAINKGMAKATGEIVNWLNSDDYYMPKALHHVASVFSAAKVTAYCGRSRVFSETMERLSSGTDVYDNNLAKTIGWARIDQPETFFRRSVWQQIGFLNEDFHYTMDKEWWIRYLLSYGLSGIVKDEQVLVNFRIHNQSKTGSQQEKFHQETIDLFYSLAKLNPNCDTKVFEQLQGVPKNIFGYHKNEPQLIEDVINYFLLNTLFAAYAQDNYPLAEQIKHGVNIYSLQEIDRRELRKTLFKLKYLPVGIKRMYNRIKI